MASFWHEMDTMQIQMNRVIYECRICDYQFPSPIQLTVHCILLHGALPCAICLKLFVNEQALNTHTRTNHMKIKRFCSDCAEECSSEKELYFHLVRVHYKKQCQLCDTLISFDACNDHMSNFHKVTTNTPIKLIIDGDHRKEFQCYLCDEPKSVDRLDKLFSHFLYFHKCSLHSLIQCILNDNAIESLRSMESSADDTLAKCSACQQLYSWSSPKIAHQIYCHGFHYCAKCDVSVENDTKFIEHIKDCEVPEINFCDNCNTTDDFDSHLKTVHNFTKAAIDSKVSDLLSSHFDCYFCGRNLKSEAIHLRKLMEHFLTVHKFNAQAILCRLKKKPDRIALNEDQDCIDRRSPKNVGEILTIVKHDENTNVRYLTEFDAKCVKFIYSSVSDYDSSESDDNTAKPSCKSYQCDFCTFRSKSKFVHAMHLHKRHGFGIKIPEFRCNVCQKTFKSNRSLKTHNQNAHHKKRENEKRFKCPFCAFHNNGKWKMRQHISEHIESSYHPCQSRAIGFTCRYCHFIFWTKEKLSEHQLCRHSDSISDVYLLCRLCYSAFNNLATLRSHNLSRHFEHRPVDGKAYQCIICRIVLFSIDEIRLHMQELHPDCRSMYCAKANCLQMASTIDELSEHWSRVHAKSVFQCLECFKLFEQREFVENHMVKSHAKLRNKDEC